MKENTLNKLTLALGIALLPPIWAVLSPMVWAVIAIFVMEKLSFNPNAELYCTLFVMGGLAVLIGESIPKFIFTPAWLCGWAIGLTIMGPMAIADIGTLPLQIGAAMIAGVVYVGIGVDAFQKLLIKAFSKK